MKPKRKQLFITLMFVLISAGVYFFYTLKPVDIDFFAGDCNSFEGLLFNNAGVKYTNVSVTIHYKTNKKSEWASSKKYFKGDFLPGERFGFRLCGEELEKIERYYLELKKEKTSESY